MSDHELAAIDAAAISDAIPVGDLQSLPPVDRGAGAWLTLAACFLLEGTIWGCVSALSHLSVLI
jgi:hypothetical protein